MKKKNIIMLCCTTILIGSLTACKASVDTVKEQQPTEQTQPTEQVQPSEQAKSTEGAQITEIAKSTEQANPSEQVNPSGQPDPAKVTESAINDVSYQIDTVSYEKDNTSLKYPKITGLANKELEDKSNSILENFALYNADQYGAEDTYSMNYKVVTQTNDFISIVLEAYVNMKASAYPSSNLYSLNIDLKQDKILRLKDMGDLKTISKNIMNNTGITMYNLEGNELDEEWKKAIIEYVTGLTEGNLTEELNAYDVDSETKDTSKLLEETMGYSYMKDDKLHVCLNVPHALGDCIIFEINE